MKRHGITFAMLLAIALLATGSAFCAITVTPNNMQGWSNNLISAAMGYITDVAPPGGLGTGAYWSFLGGNGFLVPPTYPGQAWLGTNKYTGKRIDTLTRLTYKEYTTNSGMLNGNGTYSTVRQPYGIRLVITDEGGTTHMLVYRPRPNSANGAQGSQPGYGFASYPDDSNLLNQWLEHDCILGNGLWVEFTYMANPCLWSGTWNDVLVKYPNATIATPAVQPGGDYGEWPEANPVNTPGGCGLSIQWGGEQMGSYNATSYPQGDQPYSMYKNWWRDSYEGWGWCDDVKVYFDDGVNAIYDEYDFEADTKVASKTATTTGLWDKVALSARSYQRYVGIGKVEGAGFEQFTLNDGGKKILVRCLGNTVVNGQLVRCEGILLPRYSVGSGIGTNSDPRLHVAPVSIIRMDAP